MRKIVELLIVLLALSACTNTTTNGNKNEEFGTIDEYPVLNEFGDAANRTPLIHYLDSIVKVYPNYNGNVVAIGKICEDFKTKIGSLPGILAGSTFTLNDLMQVQGKVIVDFCYVKDSDVEEFIHLNVHCIDFDKEKAATLKNGGTYKITGGVVVNYEPTSETSADFLSGIELGDLFVSNLEVVEI